MDNLQLPNTKNVVVIMVVWTELGFDVDADIDLVVVIQVELETTTDRPQVNVNPKGFLLQVFKISSKTDTQDAGTHTDISSFNPAFNLSRY